MQFLKKIHYENASVRKQRDNMQQPYLSNISTSSKCMLSIFQILFIWVCIYWLYYVQEKVIRDPIKCNKHL